MNNEIEATWTIAFKVWWSMFWRTIVWLFIPVLITSFIAGMLMYFIFGDAAQQYSSLVGGLIGFAIGMPMMLFIYKKILNKSYKNFRITIIEK